MTRLLTKKDSGKIFDFDINAKVQGKHQWLFDDEFHVYTIYNPLIDWSNKLILIGDFTYKDDVLESALITEMAFFYIQRIPDGIIEEHGYGYKLGEGISGDINNPFSITEKDATGVSFHYSNHEYQQDWTSGTILSGYPPSNDRSVIEESIFGNYVKEGWISNPFSISLSSSNLTDLEAYSYIASHNDLISAFGIDIEAAKSHYENHGKAEGRSLTGFSASDYLAKYSDLSAAFGNDETSALKHYIQFGYAEGRTDSTSGSSSGGSSNLTDFQALNYIASYGDLINAFGLNLNSAKSHYANHGKSEGRILDNFDEWGYLASNNDLMKAFESNTSEAVRHYILYGHSEGRSLTSFDAQSYLNNYADLRNAFGNDQELATKHYVEYGLEEGRIFT